MVTPKAVIADDEANLRVYLKSKLAEVWPELDICGEAENGKKALELIEKYHPDIVFLDIRMPGLSGLDVAKKIADVCWIVFVTAHDQYAIEAFENEAIDYLLKPVTRERLKNTVKRLKQRIIVPPKYPENINKILEHLTEIVQQTNNKSHLQWIRAQHGRDIRMIPVDDVFYFKAKDKYTLVITQEGESLIRKPIKELSRDLAQDKFRQISRGIIINLACIDKVSRSLTGRFQVRLKDHPDVLTVSRTYSHLFKQM